MNGGADGLEPAIHFTSGDQFSRAQMVANLERPVPAGQVYRDICGPKGRALPLGDSAWRGFVPTFPGSVRESAACERKRLANSMAFRFDLGCSYLPECLWEEDFSANRAALSRFEGAAEPEKRYKLLRLKRAVDEPNVARRP